MELLLELESSGLLLGPSTDLTGLATATSAPADEYLQHPRLPAITKKQILDDISLSVSFVRSNFVRALFKPFKKSEKLRFVKDSLVPIIIMCQKKK